MSGLRLHPWPQVPGVVVIVGDVVGGGDLVAGAADVVGRWVVDNVVVVKAALVGVVGLSGGSSTI